VARKTKKNRLKGPNGVAKKIVAVNLSMDVVEMLDAIRKSGRHSKSGAIDLAIRKTFKEFRDSATASGS
jgi:hypothetical protein